MANRPREREEAEDISVTLALEGAKGLWLRGGV